TARATMTHTHHAFGMILAREKAVVIGVETVEHRSVCGVEFLARDHAVMVGVGLSQHVMARMTRTIRRRLSGRYACAQARHGREQNQFTHSLRSCSPHRLALSCLLGRSC